jgi:rSAM/selenodomain-associated transferase 1
MSCPPNQLGVFAKFWTPGSVKTRLAADIGDERAAALYRVFVETTLQRLSRLAARRELCIWPPDRRQEFLSILPPGWDLSIQSEGDLGRRMAEFFDRAFALGSRRVVLVGSDTPSLPTSIVERAFKLLEATEVVLGASLDGGYYLIGSKDRTPALFDRIAWSTPAVWDQTMAALERAGMRRGGGFAVTPHFGDVDTLDDLRRLRRQLASAGQLDASLSLLAATIDEVMGDAR